MRKFLFTVFALCLLLGSSVAAEWKWSSKLVDPNEGTFTALKADPAGNLHLAYLAGSMVRYGYLPKNAEKWYMMDLAPGGEYVRLNLDPSGNPHVCSTGHGELRHYWFDGQKWQGERVSPATASIQFSCSVGVGPDGTVHMVWYPLPVTESDDNVLHIRYGAKRENVWYLRTLDYGGESGKWNTLEVDAKGNPHVSYSCFRDKRLGYATIVNNEWKFDAVDQNTSPLAEFPVGIGNDLAIAPDGRPRITYQDSVTVRYAEPDVNGVWKTETVDQVASRHGWTDYRTRLTFDSEAHPHIVYPDGGALKHAWKDDAGWHVQFIAPKGTNQHPFASITAGPNNKLFVVYRDTKDGSLQLATGTLSSATADDAKAIDSPNAAPAKNPALSGPSQDVDATSGAAATVKPKPAASKSKSGVKKSTKK
ncbi:MAG TPA: hypothetical protein VN577_20900 [Terriglobales bacterium]|nr:hypothetical protein [Terriglobales bacterium]